MQNSRVLFLIICSNGKIRGGEPAYNPQNALASILPLQAKSLQEARRSVLRLLTSKTLARQGLALCELPYNRELVAGRDFGGSNSGRYLPAAARYQGRFYRELGPDRLQLLSSSRHHVLILSGLYGLVTPFELIQAYSCHVLDHCAIEETWRSTSLLTSVLLAYLKKYDIHRLFDFTAADAYRRLVDWTRVRQRVEVFRAFGNQNAGPDLLPSLAFLMRDALLPTGDNELLSITPGKTFYADLEEVTFVAGDEPPEGYPREEVNREAAKGNSLSLPKPAGDDSRPSEQSPTTKGRYIPVTGGKDNTMFGCRINSIDDLPAEARDIFRDLGRNPDILGVNLGAFTGAIPKSRAGFSISLAEPQPNSGHVYGKLKGPGKIGGIQKIDIRVTQGRELFVYFFIRDQLWAEL